MAVTRIRTNNATLIERRYRKIIRERVSPRGDAHADFVQGLSLRCGCLEREANGHVQLHRIRHWRSLGRVAISRFGAAERVAAASATLRLKSRCPLRLAIGFRSSSLPRRR